MKITLIANTITASLFKELLMHQALICLCQLDSLVACMMRVYLRLSNLHLLGEEKKILTTPCMDLNGSKVWPLILGVSAYPLKAWLMHPFQDNGALTPGQRLFNWELSQARIVVGHGFGQTNARWRWLDERIDEDTMKIPDTITACCMLHNICILMQDDFDAPPVNSFYMVS